MLAGDFFHFYGTGEWKSYGMAFNHWLLIITVPHPACYASLPGIRQLNPNLSVRFSDCNIISPIYMHCSVLHSDD